MPYIIDGHNLIPKVPGLSLGDIDDEVGLIKVLQDFCRQERKKAEVYFDQAPPGSIRTQKHGWVTAHFIRRGRTADEAIQARLREIGRAGSNWTVVTSDNAVAAAARDARARVISAEVFARDLFSNSSIRDASLETDPEAALDAEAVDEWLRIFGENEDEAGK
jgi:predicted RNA-binding protein with PIN domain